MINIPPRNSSNPGGSQKSTGNWNGPRLLFLSYGRQYRVSENFRDLLYCLLLFISITLHVVLHLLALNSRFEFDVILHQSE